ncbi:MAG: hypothetical protein AB7U59_02080 [Desulfovibrionaceae bacterium]
MRFDVPFVPDPDYVALLAANRGRLASVHFRLSPETPDGRLPGCGDATPEDIREGLSALPGVTRLGLLNARFHDPSVLSEEGLRDLVFLLEGYLAAGVLDGIVYADHYLLMALSDAAPDVARALVAVPSVNSRPDSAARAVSLLEYAAATRFKPSNRLVLDRSLNRDTARLAATVTALRRACPDLSIGVLANEGCLYACPFKAAHDGHVALSRLVPAQVGPELREGLGCLRLFFEERGRILASPFLRPEDTARLEGVVDFCKLGGRTREPAALRDVVAAYLAGSYTGNLLWLLDTLEALAGRLWLDNAALPVDFFERTDGCSHTCRTCGYCADLAARLIRDRGVDLRPLGGH